MIFFKIREMRRIKFKLTGARSIHREGHWFRESFSKKGNEPEGYARFRRR
jgi:hypothetical protein